MKKLNINIFAVLGIITLIISRYQKYIIYYFFAVIIHEIGHYFVIKLRRIKIKKIEVLPFGCYFHLNLIEESVIRDLLMYIMGIVFNILFLFTGILFDNKMIIDVNLQMILFNSLPIYPLDGYYILLTTLASNITYQKSIIISEITSFIVIVLIVFIILLEKNGFIYLIYALYYLYLLINRVKNNDFYYEKFLLDRYLNHKNLLLYKNKKESLPLVKYLYYGKLSYFKIGSQIIFEKDLLKNRYINSKNR